MTNRPGAIEALRTLLGELPPRVRAAIDTTVFAPLDEPLQRRVVDLSAAHVVAYDTRVAGHGLPLCTVVRHARLAPDQIAQLRAAERELPAHIVLVAYSRPARLRASAEVLLGRRVSTARTGTTNRPAPHNAHAT